MSDFMKDGITLAIKGIGIGVCGASIQALNSIGASVILEIPLIFGFSYLIYLSVKQIYIFFKK